jgi:hypothetical protein
MLKLGKLCKTGPQATFERVAAVELANLRGRPQPSWRAWNRRAFMRLPQTFMLHQRLV